jgi:hypothetical protein
MHKMKRNKIKMHKKRKNKIKIKRIKLRKPRYVKKEKWNQDYKKGRNK